MSQAISVLVLRLEGVLQSWGEHAKWNNRDSSVMPTKSGIIGLLGCALGWGREDKRFLTLSSQLRIVVRADRAGRLISDFQTVSAKKLMNAAGEQRQGGNTLVTNRYYLQDAFFTIFITGDKGLLQKLEQALKEPKWPLYLGRKSCVPSRPVLDGSIREFETIDQAVSEVPYAERADASVLLEIEIDSVDLTGTSLQRPDELGESYRAFVNRNVMRKTIQRGEGNVSQ